jgi:outer membrane protein
MRLLLNAGVLLLWITGHGAATELPQRSLDECIAFAIEHHPSLKAAQASVDAGGQRVWQVTSVYLPQVDANYNANRRQTSATATTGAEIGTITRTFSFYTTGFSLTQILFDFGQNLNRIRAAQAVEESLVADSLTQREAVIFNVKQAYFNVLAAKRLLNVADESVRQSESHLEQAQGRFDVGFAPRFDVTQSQVQLAQAQLNQVTARNTVRAARATLGNTLGLSGPPPFDVAEAFEARPVAVD